LSAGGSAQKGSSEMHTQGPVGYRRFILSLFAALALAASGCADDDVGADGDDDDDDDDQGTEADAGNEPPDAQPPDIDAAPVPDAAVETTVSFIGMGNSVACAVLSTGSVRCWGANEQGQVGIGVYGDQGSPTDVIGLTDAATVDCGTAHCCARTTQGGAQCWGWNAAGELAANMDGGQLGNRNTPGAALEEPPGGKIAAVEGATQVTSGGAHNCALKGSEVWCWGWNAAGQGGRDPAAEANLFVGKPTGITSIAQLALAHTVLAEHSCGITTAGEAVCWGLNNRGQLGDSTTTGRHTAAPVSGLIEVTALAAGQQHTCAVAKLADSPKSDPGVYCWGHNDLGQSGPSAATPIQTTAVEVPDVAGAVAVAGGQSHTCALLATGGVRCWGANNFGQLGDGTEVGHATPSDVVSPDGTGLLTGVVQIATGFGNSCARTEGGRVYCWGENARGQLGQGTIGGDLALRPVEVPVLPEE
jgi:alpha-tubulin suppressor-like RCC1 family protein